MATHSTRDGTVGKDCRRCRTWKPLTEFYSKGKTTFDGVDSMCKGCFNDRKRARSEGVELSRADEHRTINGIEKKHCPTCNTWKGVTDFTKCKSRKDGLQGICKPCFSSARKKYRSSAKGKATEKKYDKKRYDTDPAFRMRMCISSRINKVLKSKSQRKSSSTMDLVGCSKLKLQCHLEKQFDEFMSWSNFGKWHIDHKIPCCAFDASNPAECAAMWHYTNLQPMWATENLRKSGSFDPAAKASYIRAWADMFV